MAQQSASASAAGALTSSAVPNLINYSGVLKDANGHTLTGITGVTFLLYKDEHGGAPLWLETQNVTPDRLGHYAVQLGAASTNGIPADLFLSGEPRWLAVQVASEAEQSRVLLVAPSPKTAQAQSFTQRIAQTERLARLQAVATSVARAPKMPSCLSIVEGAS